MVLLSTNNNELLQGGLKQRRDKLAKLIEHPVIFWSGSPLRRNFSANKFPFRASSLFLYFAGIPLPNAAIYLDAGRLELYLDDPPASATLWHGEVPTRVEIGEKIGADGVYPFAELSVRVKEARTIAV
ncbi:MAG: aminopeptidase P N-terminal domain-containing protein, partial [Pleurocapsa sp.]